MMKRRHVSRGSEARSGAACSRVGIVLLVLAASALAASSGYAQDVDQSFALTAGWNAIQLSVEPPDPDPAVVFAGLAVESIWAWNPAGTAIQFIQSPGDLSLDDPAWLRWLPPNAPDAAILTNLFAIEANRAYLVRLGAPGVLDVTGHAVPPTIDWQPGGFHLTGLPVAAAPAITFSEFFSESTAHVPPVVYRIAADAEHWEMIPDPAVDTVVPGEAYWIFSDTGSAYTGGIEVILPQGDHLDYAVSTERQVIRIRNLDTAARTVDVRALSPSHPGALFTRDPTPSSTPNWLALPQSYDVPGGGFVDVELAVQRSVVAPGTLTATVEIADQVGDVVRAPLTADAPYDGTESVVGLWVGQVTVGGVSGVNGLGVQTTVAGAGTDCLVCPADDPATTTVDENDCSYAGQPTWVIGVESGYAGQCVALAAPCGSCAGDATCLADCVADAVCEDPVPECQTRLFPGDDSVCPSYAANCMDPYTKGQTPWLVAAETGGFHAAELPASPFTFRMLLHVDANLEVRLLKDVVMMFDPTEGVQDFVLLTDDGLIPNYVGIATRDGERVGRRISTAAYDFAGTKLPMTSSGDFGEAGSVHRATVDVPESTNPFRHKFQKDHKIGVPVSREIQIRFGDSAGSSLQSGWSELDADYREIVTGLHRQPIQAGGSMHLRKLTDVDTLDLGAP